MGMMIVTINHDVTPEKPLLGISACLLGERVRFDANHKHDHYITGTLGQYFDFFPVCPEVAIGMGIPRPTIRLVGDMAAPRLVGVKVAELDVTDKMRDFSRKQVKKLPSICGYVLKSKSPSCGMERVKVYSEKNGINGTGAGLYAEELLRQHPTLPVEEEGRLGDPGLRDNFLERVFVYRRWQQLVASGLSKKKIIDFHSAHKLSLMAHGADHYRALGKMVADMKQQPLKTFADDYLHALMKALRYDATNKKQTNVLHHLMGYLKKQLSKADKAELLEIIDAYRDGRVPLLVPITLLKHHFRHHPHDYISNQYYLNPEPDEMLLRRSGL